MLIALLALTLAPALAQESPVVLPEEAVAPPPAPPEAAPETELEVATGALEAAVDEAPPAKANPWDKVGWGWGGVPAVAYNSDDGLGGGILGSIYRYNGHSAPYKASATLLLYVTTKQVHTHRIDLDLLEVGGKPLRLNTRVEFSATNSANFCGVGPDSMCDEAVAVSEALEAGLVDDPDNADDSYDQFVRRYYKVRQVEPNAFFNARYRIKDMPNRVELMGSWWGGYLIPGSFTEHEPFPGSLYANSYPGGEEGFYSTFQLGAMLDNRDNEPAPTSGYWIEASVRGAAPFTGSHWTYFGFNTTARAYASLIPSDRLILADRFAIDGMFGDPSTNEMARMGGSQIYSAFGGQRAGRGVRLRGVMGKAKFLNQTELRYTVWSPMVLHKVQIDVTPIAFFDAGYWAAEWSDIPSGNAGFVYGTGGGLRLAFNKNFILRGDVGLSPREGWATSIYIDINNLW